MLFFLFFVFSTNAFAHKASDSYLYMQQSSDGFQLQWDIALRDLEKYFLFDKNFDGLVDWGEVKEKSYDVESFAKDNLIVKQGSHYCHLNSMPIRIKHYVDGAYLALSFDSECDLTGAIDIQYKLFFKQDVQHRGLLRIAKGDDQNNYVFSPNKQKIQYGEKRDSNWKAFTSFVQQGIWHIWIGYDHILFLLSLLLPAVLYLNSRKWFPVDDFKLTVIDAVKIVTAFTIAHSITLAMVILAGIKFQVSWIESLIALSVILVALNNIYPILIPNRWIMGFVFGLVHGFGFASVLSELDMNTHNLLVSLLGFNIGVEIGQLIIVMAFLPIAYRLRNSAFYQAGVLKIGSIIIACMGFFWFVERSA